MDNQGYNEWMKRYLAILAPLGPDFAISKHNLKRMKKTGTWRTMKPEEFHARVVENMKILKEKKDASEKTHSD